MQITICSTDSGYYSSFTSNYSLGITQLTKNMFC